MKSMQHVLWRGALALSLVAIGIGSGLGMPPAERVASIDDCAGAARLLAADAPVDAGSARRHASLRVLRRLSPAG